MFKLEKSGHNRNLELILEAAAKSTELKVVASRKTCVFVVNVTVQLKLLLFNYITFIKIKKK